MVSASVVDILFGFQYLSGLCVDLVVVLIACRFEFHLIDKPAVIMILFGLVENRVLRLYSGVLQSDGFCFFGGYRVSGIGCIGREERRRRLPFRLL